MQELLAKPALKDDQEIFEGTKELEVELKKKLESKDKIEEESSDEWEEMDIEDDWFNVQIDFNLSFVFLI